MKWFLKRAGEPSSWAGLGIALNAVYQGVYAGVDPIMAVGLGLPALLAFIQGEKGGK